MRAVDEDHTLTVLAEVGLRLTGGDFEGLQDRVVELGEKNDYSVKIYNLLALSLVRQGKSAQKVLSKGLGQSNILGGAKPDDQLVQFATNYLRFGQRGKDYDAVQTWLSTNKPDNSYNDAVKQAEQMFDEACQA